MFDGGGREDSDDVRERTDDLGGDREPLLGLYGTYGAALLKGGGMFGAVSRMEGDGGPEDRDEVDGRYDDCEDSGLETTSGELLVSNFTCAVARRIGACGELPTWAREDHLDELVAASS